MSEFDKERAMAGIRQRAVGDDSTSTDATYLLTQVDRLTRALARSERRVDDLAQNDMRQANMIIAQRAEIGRLKVWTDRLSNGWVPFGWHIGYDPSPELDFDGQGEDGLPEWERVKSWEARP